MSCIDSGSTALMFFATTIVMIQTPAMGIAQAGLIRQKNTLSMLIQVKIILFSKILFGTSLGSLLWVVVGFSLTFGPSIGGIIGNPVKHFFLDNIDPFECFSSQQIPKYLYVAFQMMFAIMTPLIMTGAWAEVIILSMERE